MFFMFYMRKANEISTPGPRPDHPGTSTKPEPQLTNREQDPQRGSAEAPFLYPLGIWLVGGTLARGIPKCFLGQVFLGRLGAPRQTNHTFSGTEWFFGLGTPGLRKTTWPKKHFGSLLLAGPVSPRVMAARAFWTSLHFGVLFH